MLLMAARWVNGFIVFVENILLKSRKLGLRQAIGGLAFSREHYRFSKRPGEGHAMSQSSCFH